MFDPKLLLPEKLYALPGFEINIYFQNVVTVINPANFAFDVECEKGRCDALRWRWTPDETDVGEHKLKLSVWSDEGLLAEAETTVIVSPRNAGEGGKLTILQIGASCTSAKGRGEQLVSRFRLPGNPQLVMLGSHGPGYAPVEPGDRQTKLTAAGRGGPSSKRKDPPSWITTDCIRKDLTMSPHLSFSTATAKRNSISRRICPRFAAEPGPM